MYFFRPKSYALSYSAYNELSISSGSGPTFDKDLMKRGKTNPTIWLQSVLPLVDLHLDSCINSSRLVEHFLWGHKGGERKRKGQLEAGALVK